MISGFVEVCVGRPLKEGQPFIQRLEKSSLELWASRGAGSNYSWVAATIPRIESNDLVLEASRALGGSFWVKLYLGQKALLGCYQLSAWNLSTVAMLQSARKPDDPAGRNLSR